MFLSSLQSGLHASIVAAHWLASSGLSRSIFTNPWSILMILMGIAGVSLGVVGLIQTRRWPPGQTQAVVADADEENPEDEAAQAPQAPLRGSSPTATTHPPAWSPREDPSGHVRLGLPQILERHPDVWSHDEPLDVAVTIEKEALGGQDGGTCTLFVQRNSEKKEIDRAHAEPGKDAVFTVSPPGKGEAHLIARLHVGDETLAENARFIRFVDYRSEIVETFEDFEKWARTHYPFPNRSLTAREFTDRYADLVPGTPTPPLELIVDIYELANFSDHGVDRSLYLQLVDAFLELEDAGALEGPAAEAA